MYYNYHFQAKKRIKEGKLTHFEIVDEWNNISPALVLHFIDNKSIPIREEYFNEYLDFISTHSPNSKWVK